MTRTRQNLAKYFSRGRVRTKSETRGSKSEGNPKSEILRAGRFAPGSGFGPPSAFGFRDSEFDQVKYLSDALAKKLIAWFLSNARDLPWRRTRDPYAIWIAEVMLQQTQVRTVLPFWERWMRALPDIESLALANRDQIHKLWEGLGYYTRAQNLQKAAQIILTRHSGIFPRRFEEVLELPGVGPYTAGAICSIAFNQPKPVLDGNVIRVLTRVFGIGGNPRGSRINARLWRIAQQLVTEASALKPDSFTKPADTHSSQKKAGLAGSPAGTSKASNAILPCSLLNQSLMELGAILCTPKRPKCDICPLVEHCAAHAQDRTEKLPSLPRRPRPTLRRFIAVVLTNRGRWLVRRRPAGIVNGHLWEFPNAETGPGCLDIKPVIRRIIGFLPTTIGPFCTIRHSITRYRITLEVFRAHSAVPPNNGRRLGHWFNARQLQARAFPNAHRRVVERLLHTTEASDGKHRD